MRFLLAEMASRITGESLVHRLCCASCPGAVTNYSMNFLQDLSATARSSGEPSISGIADLVTGDLRNSNFYRGSVLFPQIWGWLFGREEAARGKCPFIMGLHFTD